MKKKIKWFLIYQYLNDHLHCLHTFVNVLYNGLYGAVSLMTEGGLAGTDKIFSSIKNLSALINSSFDTLSSPYHKKIFFVQSGISTSCASVVGIDAGTNNMLTRKIPNDIVRLFFRVTFYYGIQ